MSLIYLDNAATTRLLPEVLGAMTPYLTENYANASSIYRFAGVAKNAVEDSRETIAKFINAKPEEIYFTSGGTESDNWAIKAVAEAYAKKGKHLITSTVEHHAVLHTFEYLQKQGYEVTYVGVDENGVVKLDELENAIRPDTTLISIMYANNEIGTIQPVAEIGRIAKAHGVLFHTDAVQAYGHLPIDVVAENIDLLSASAHKVNGPKGVGLLYVNKKVRIGSLLHGGAQERGRRGGTYNTAGIVGFAKATELASLEMDARREYEQNLRDYFIEQIESKIPHVRLNGHRTNRLSNNVNFSFRFVEGESLLIMLDMLEVAASSGSACTSGALDPSHVLLAIGLPHEIAHGSIRYTLSHETTREEIDRAVAATVQVVERLRKMSPLWEDFLKEGE